MELVQNGESSKSPRLQAHSPFHNEAGHNSDSNGPTRDEDIVMGDEDGGPGLASGSNLSENYSRSNAISKLVLPVWDVPPPKPLHSSLDLISLLHLDTLYNTYVRPFADVRNEENPAGLEGENEGGPGVGGQGDRKPVHSGGGSGAGGKKGSMKKKRMEKGYQHLIEDCIDPTPMGTKGDNLSLLPLVPDFTNHPGPPPPLFPERIELLPNEAFQIARLEPGTKQDGYANGVKVGVREAEEKRKKKRAAKISVPPPDIGSMPSPGIGPNGLPSPNFLKPYPTSAPGTPLLPVLPPQRPPFPLNTTRAKNSTTPQPASAGVGVGVRPFPVGSNPNVNPIPNYNSNVKQAGSAAGSGTPGGGGGRPYAPYKRPGSADVQSTTHKRVKSGSVGPPTGAGPGSGKGSGSRSASPMPMSHGGGGGTSNGSGGQRKLKPGMRSKTEGVQ